jgi:phosphatidylinositol-4-phosphate 3-kinase
MFVCCLAEIVMTKNNFFSFIQLEYRMPLDVVQYKILQATIWSHDSLQENEFLGGIIIELCNINLTSETTSWYNLSNVHR